MPDYLVLLLVAGKKPILFTEEAPCAREAEDQAKSRIPSCISCSCIDVCRVNGENVLPKSMEHFYSNRIEDM